MTKFEIKTFKIPELKGISKKAIEEHLKLYEGYVKNANTILESEKPDYRRFSFEFNGMRNHELYFQQFEGGASSIKSLAGESKLQKLMEVEWGSYEKWLESFKELAMTRGVGWAILYHDPQTGKLLNAWVDEQHLGHLNNCEFILGLDMWEHSYLFDYTPGDKKKYVEAFFENLNWPVVLRRFDE